MSHVAGRVSALCMAEIERSQVLNKPHLVVVKNTPLSKTISPPIRAFLSGMPAASLYAAREGLSQAGVKRNEGIGVFEDLMDARSLFLTPNSTTVYVS